MEVNDARLSVCLSLSLSLSLSVLSVVSCACATHTHGRCWAVVVFPPNFSRHAPTNQPTTDSIRSSFCRVASNGRKHCQLSLGYFVKRPKNGLRRPSATFAMTTQWSVITDWATFGLRFRTMMAGCRRQNATTVALGSCVQSVCYKLAFHARCYVVAI